MSSVHPSSSPAAPRSPTGRSFGWLIAGVSLISFGCMVLALALAFVRDLRSLRDAPGVLWSALCGQPVQSELTLPVLLAVGALTLLVGALFLLIARLQSRSPIEQT
ncbi:MAG: hypothetical protein RMN25_05390 [Anaerolineae bacterium]|nr:hypothetical protein [Thermoflexales bacterium]MDW8407200.1 hypothetical protein [Anaerolineae bacterium]